MDASVGGEEEPMLDMLEDACDIYDNCWLIVADGCGRGGWLMVMLTFDAERDCDMTLLFDEEDDWAT